MKKPDLSISGMFKWVASAVTVSIVYEGTILFWFLVAGFIFQVSYNHIAFKFTFLNGLIPPILSYADSLALLFVFGIPIGILRAASYKREVEIKQ